MSSQVIRVAQLVHYLKKSIDNDSNLRSLMVSGELSNVTNHRSGHIYFSLKDDQAKMNCVMFKTQASKLSVPFENGMKVIVTCSVSMYEAQGSMQLYVTKMVSDGVGDLHLMLEQLKKKLYDQGLFDERHKKRLPSYPTNIGIVSAKTGAALQDVLQIIHRRWPSMEVTLYPSLVQGMEASRAMIKQLQLADMQQHDLILLVRGGGSIEDLWCFNDESLAITVFNLNTVIVTGVGHEIDTTLVDYVSDVRAPTPSAAAELVTPNQLDVLAYLQQVKNKMAQQLQLNLTHAKRSLSTLSNRPIMKQPELLWKDYRTQLMMNEARLGSYELYMKNKQHQVDQYKASLNETILLWKQKKDHQFSTTIKLLEAYSPLHSLSRGYSIAKGEHIITSIKDLTINEHFTLRLQDGTIQAKRIEDKIDGTRN